MHISKLKILVMGPSNVSKQYIYLHRAIHKHYPPRCVLIPRNYVLLANYCLAVIK